jgi:hypothetical protein
MADDKQAEFQFNIVNVEMHALDAKSKIIEQEPNLSLSTDPEFVTLLIENERIKYVIGMEFHAWQKLTTKLYVSVKASMLSYTVKQKVPT